MVQIFSMVHKTLGLKTSSSLSFGTSRCSENNASTNCLAFFTFTSIFVSLAISWKNFCLSSCEESKSLSAASSAEIFIFSTVPKTVFTYSCDNSVSNSWSNSLFSSHCDSLTRETPEFT